MITNRSLRFAFCALLLLAPLAALSAQETDDMMQDDEGFYVTAAYGVTMPATRDVSDDVNTVSIGTEFGLLGGRFGVGYGVDGFRPEVSVGLRIATVDSLKGLPAEGTMTAVDLGANVYYDIVGGGSEFSLYLGVGGGVTLITPKLEPVDGFDVTPFNDSATALSVQAAVGIGYAVMEDLTLTLGYRLVGTMEAKFSNYDTSKAKTDMTLSHNVEAGLRLSL